MVSWAFSNEAKLDMAQKLPCVQAEETKTVAGEWETGPWKTAATEVMKSYRTIN